MTEHRHENEDKDDLDLEREIERDVEKAGQIGREVERAAREAEREAHRIEREAQREARRSAREADREARREEHRTHRMHLLGGTLTIDTGSAGREESELVERRFDVSGMPRVRIRNVSGETSVKVGQAGEVFVRARKRVHGWSEDRAKRLLENVEVLMEQSGDEITIEPRLYEQERGWMDLFRGGRVAVDIDVTVPREAQIEATTVSGPLSVTGTRGPVDGRSVSGEVMIDDVQGPMRLRTVSGDLRAAAYAGQIEANSVSGDLRFERSRIRRPDVVTVSGDVRVEGALVLGAEGEAEGRIKTVSGDIDLVLADPAIDLEFHSLSGDLDVDAGTAKVEKTGRREWHVSIGQGGPRVRVKTVSGDLSIRRSAEAGGGAPQAPAEEPMPMGAPAAPTADQPDVLELLGRVARGEMSVEEASSALDRRRS